MAAADVLSDFLEFSSVLTGFSALRFQGTGQGKLYLATLVDVIGEETVRELLMVFRGIRRDSVQDEAALERAMRCEILSDAKLGPVARNLIKLWYVGTWYQLPLEWREVFAASGNNRTFVVSPEAYTEGLLWPAIGANPSGAKPFGYAMWATPPRIETI